MWMRCIFKITVLQYVAIWVVLAFSWLMVALIEVEVVEEQAEEYRELRRKGIEYHRMRSQR